MAVDRQRVEARLVYIRSRLAALRSIAGGTDAERFAADPLMPPAARYHLQTAIEALTDIAYHLCAKGLEYAPQDAQDAFSRLVAANILPAERAERYRDMLRFRNRIVHGYLDVDDRQVFQIMMQGSEDIRAAADAFQRRIEEDRPEQA